MRIVTALHTITPHKQKILDISYENKKERKAIYFIFCIKSEELDFGWFYNTVLCMNIFWGEK